MSSSIKKAVKRRTHRERAQPAARQKYGMLEKHKDYVLRARDYHRKEDRIKALRERATLKNPDEFYFGMINASTKDGVHVAGTEAQKAATRRDKDAFKKMATQDQNWVNFQASKNAAKIDELKESIHIMEDEESAGKAQHTIFVDDEEEVNNFDASKHFQTTPQLVTRKFNRPKVVDGVTPKIPTMDEALLAQINHSKKTKARELELRQEAQSKLEKLRKQADLGKKLMGKGQKQKIGVDEDGIAIYKWKNERKK